MTLMTPERIPQQYKLALEHQVAGRDADALAIYDRIIKLRSDIPEVHYQVGKLFLNNAEFRKSVTHLRAARILAPNQQEVWNWYISALVCLDDKKLNAEAIQALKKSGLSAGVVGQLKTRLHGKRSESAVSIGAANKQDVDSLLALTRAGRHEDAEALATRLATAHPGVALFPNLLGVIRKHKGEVRDARNLFETAIRIDANYAEAHNNLGHLLLQLGEIEPARKHLLHALVLTPGSPSVLTNVGCLTRSMNRSRDERERFFQRAVKIAPRHAEAHLELGRDNLDSGKPKEARSNLKRALRLGLKNADLLLALSRAEEDAGNIEEAIKWCDEAIAAAPRLAAAASRKAVLLQQVGDFAEAEPLFRRAIELEPNNGEHYRLLSASHKFSRDDDLIDGMKSVFTDAAVTREDRMGMGFALAKAMEDCGESAEVFSYLDEANRLMRELHPYDIETRIAEVRQITQFFADFSPERKPSSDSSDFAPIFVTGLPRSGTTLVEQVLSAHSATHGLGELGYFSQEAAKLTILAKSRQSFSQIGDRELGDLGAAYQSLVQANAPNAPRIIDKSIQTFLFMGLVKLALPNSTIVLVTRDPKDNLYSIYKNRFPQGTHLYSYDFNDVAVYYEMYREIVEFWREAMPSSFFEIRYEDLISEPEPWTRALLEACNLDWEESCLEFHRHQRTVKTLSLYQVRQPIYTSSIGSWKKYAKDLEPLFDRLSLD